MAEDKSFVGEWLSAFVGGLPSHIAALVPESFRKDVRARLGDWNPFKSTSWNHDLMRAGRIAWIEAAFAIFDVTNHPDSYHRDEPRSDEFEKCVRAALVKIRSNAFKRDEHVGSTPIDVHLTVILEGVPEYIAPHDGSVPGSKSLTQTFAEVLGIVSG